MPKRVKRKRVIRFSKKLIKGNTTLYILLAVLVLGSAVFAGLFSTIKPRPGENNIPVTIACWDAGDGPDCKPQEDRSKNQVLKLDNGAEYGLIRTKVTLVEGNLHLKDSREKFNNDPIILNSSETHHVNPDPNVPNDRRP